MVGYIHIGAPKCGSTALQQVILANIDRLGAAGIRTPRSQDFAEGLAHNFTYGWRDNDEIRLNGANSDFDPAGGDILLSSEAFLACGASSPGLRALTKSFYQDELHILGVIRDPASLLESTWFQWMRTYRAFEKVRRTMNHASLYFENYINSDWFAKINQNWQNWRSYPSVACFKEVSLGLDPFDPVDVLVEFLNRPLSNDVEQERANVSINGVTFRILKEYRNVPLRGYEDFVFQLERAMRDKGYGGYRFLSDKNALRVNHSACSLPLFRGFKDIRRDGPTAQDISKVEFDKLLEESKEIARPYSRNP